MNQTPAPPGKFWCAESEKSVRYRAIHEITGLTRKKPTSDGNESPKASLCVAKACHFEFVFSCASTPSLLVL
jgi:hypothetical protein